MSTRELSSRCLFHQDFYFLYDNCGREAVVCMFVGFRLGSSIPQSQYLNSTNRENIADYDNLIQKVQFLLI
jgi:hypothetical protein